MLTYDILCHQPKPFLADLHARLLASAAPAKPASTAGGALGCIAEDSAGDPSPASDDDVSVQRADVSETGRESIESAVPAKPGADVSGQRADVSGTGREVGGAGADVSRGADVDERGGNVKRASEEGSGDGARGKSSEEVTESDGKGVQIGGDWELEEGVRLEKEGDAKAEEDFGSRNQGQTPESISKPQATKDEAEEGVTGSQKDKETDRKETGEAGEGEGAGKGIDEGGGPGAREGGGEEHRETGPVGSMQVDRAKENTRTGECEDLASNVERGDSGEGVEKAETVSGVPAQSDGPIGDSTSEVAGAERSEQKEQTETSEEGEVLGWKTTSPDGQGAGQAVVEKQPTPGASEQSAVRAEAAGKPEGGAGDSSSGPPRNGSGDAELAALRAEVALLREKLRRLEGLPGNEDGENLEISNGGLAGGAKRALSFAERLTAVVGNKTETQSPTLEGETGTGDDRLSSMQATAGQAHGDVSAPSGDVTEGSKEEAGLDLRTLEGPSSAEARALQPTSVDTERTASVNTAPSSSVNIPQPLAEIKEAFRSATAKTTFAASRPPLISTPSVDVRLDDVKSTLDAEVKPVRKILCSQIPPLSLIDSQEGYLVSIFLAPGH